MNNFLKETKETMDVLNLNPKDIEFIGSRDGEYEMSWEEFQEVADFEYNESYGAQLVCYDLILLFKGGKMLKRGEYDGSEWWDFIDISIPSQPNPKKITRLKTVNVGWDSVAKVNSFDNED